MTKVADDAGELADGFLALPGGVDSLQGLFVLLTSGRARDAEPPCGLLNVDDYYTGLLKTADDLTVERFIRETQRGMLIVDRDPDALLRAMADFRPPETRRLFPRDDDQAF